VSNHECAKSKTAKNETNYCKRGRDARRESSRTRSPARTSHQPQRTSPWAPSCGASIGPSIRPVPLRVLSGEERDHTDPPHSLLGTLLFRSHVRSTLEIHSALPPNCSSNSAFAASPITPAGFQSSLLSRCPSWNTSCFSSRPRADLATS
jgi:hypothetical protein